MRETDQQIEITLVAQLATGRTAENNSEAHVREGAQLADQGGDERPVPSQVVGFADRHCVNRAATGGTPQRPATHGELEREEIKICHRVSSIAPSCVQ